MPYIRNRKCVNNNWEDDWCFRSS